ncbi:hypothetical protein C8J55DRAFT_495379 [Lentinula edodes]|uniref:Uncharacterized protein n=1 Tax=Lentinula lateritia TaxID=40482 RepID=A0A9W9B1E2_9AGAR|nr:hypothetical protein C8J55DRAFT_495379 [Lentinula edodes]
MSTPAMMTPIIAALFRRIGFGSIFPVGRGVMIVTVPVCVGIVVNWPLGRVEVVNSVVNSVNVSILNAVLALGVAVTTASTALLVSAVVKAEEAAFATTEVVMVVLRPVEINGDVDGELSVIGLGLVSGSPENCGTVTVEVEMEVPSVDIVSEIALRFEEVDCDMVNIEETAEREEVEVEREVVRKFMVVLPLDDDSKDIVLDDSETVLVNVESKLVLGVMKAEDSDGGVAMDVDNTEVMSLVPVFSNEEEFGVIVSEEEEETSSVDMLDTAESVEEDTSEGVYVGDEVKEIVAVVSVTEVGEGCKTVGDVDIAVVVELGEEVGVLVARELVEAEDSVLVSVCVDVVVIDERFPVERLPDSEAIAGVVVGDREFDVTFSEEDVVSAGSVVRDAPVGVDAVSVTGVVEGGIEDPESGTDVDGEFPVSVSEVDVGEEIGTPVVREPGEADDSVLVPVCVGMVVVVIDEKFPVGLPDSEVVADMVTDERPDVTVEDVPSVGSVEDTPGEVDTGVVDVFGLSVTEMVEDCEIEDVVTTVDVDGALPVVSGDEADEGVRGPVAEEPVETEGPALVLPISVAVFTGNELFSVKLEIVVVLVLELPFVDCSKVLLGVRAEVGYVVVSVPNRDSEELLVDEVVVIVAEDGRVSVEMTLGLDMNGVVLVSNVYVDE